MDVGFVHEHHRTFRFRGKEMLNVGVRRHRSSRIVRSANVKETGVRRRGEHGLDIVRIRFRERSFGDAGSRHFRRAHPGFVAGIGGDVTLRRRGEGEHREMQRLARPGEDAQVFRLQALHLGERFHEFFLQPVGIAAALRRHVHDGLARGVAGSERVFVGVDHYRSGMKNIAFFRRQGCLGGDAESHRRGRHSRQLEECPPRTIRKDLVALHPALLKCMNLFPG